MITLNTIKIGDTIKRTTGARYEVGREGEVIELDAEKMRARINWTLDHEGKQFHRKVPRTWMSFKALTKD